MRRISAADLVRPVVLIGSALVASTAAIAALESVARVDDASTTYLVVVVLAGVLYGTRTAIAAAIGAFLLYDVLFVEPLHAITVADPAELLDLLLLLFVGVVVGRLAGRQRERTAAAGRREREARALFTVSRSLALAPTTASALPELVATLVRETAFTRVAITLTTSGGRDVTAADSAPGEPLPDAAVQAVLQRKPGDEPAAWVLVHAGAPARRGPRAVVPHRVAIEAPGAKLGSLRALRPIDAGPPTREETRLLAATADQVGRALERDRLAAEATSAEIARRSDELKSALLDSVSHELRTPLAAIRAAAGTLADPAVDWPSDEVRTSAAAIDREAVRLAQLVSNLLDLGRIEGGALRPARAPWVLADLVADAVARAVPLLGGRPVTVDVAPDLPAVLVDPVHIDLVLANLLENAARYTPAGAPLRIGALRRGDSGAVRLTLEDGGSGVPDATLPRLFDKFYRVPQARDAARRGTGIGLTIVRGLVEAMGGSVTARRSELGGLALDIDVPLAPPSAAEEGEPGPGMAPLDAAALDAAVVNPAAVNPAAVNPAPLDAAALDATA